jgi:hypothetical protein
MNRQTYFSFLEIWYPSSQWASIVAVGLAILISCFYYSWYFLIRNRSVKYDFVSRNELPLVKVITGLLFIGLFFILNLTFKEVIRLYGAWFIIRLVVSGLICGFLFYVVQVLIDAAYSATVRSRLEKIRYKPMISDAGNTMKLLSEEEEDVYLSPGMQAEEQVESLDYDVWIDSISQQVKIEKYKGSALLLKCPVCGYHCLKKVKEVIVSPPSHENTGSLVKVFKCQYCHHSTRKYFSYTTSIENISR